MKILFDQGTPAPLRRFLTKQQVSTAAELGWSQLTNGDLLNQAERSGYECLITTDQNLRYQQNLSERTISILVLRSASWPRIQTRIDEIVEAVESLASGSYLELDI